MDASEGISGNHSHRLFMQVHSPSLQCQLRYSSQRSHLEGRLDRRSHTVPARPPSIPAGAHARARPLQGFAAGFNPDPLATEQSDECILNMTANVFN
jgi:hypothetical protein